jgi:hypothetical protein
VIERQTIFDFTDSGLKQVATEPKDKFARTTSLKAFKILVPTQNLNIGVTPK